MKKFLKIFLIVIVVIVAIILLDFIQALVFDNNPIIGIETRGMKRKGILVDTYHLGNRKHDTVIKGFSYSSSYDENLTIIDKSKGINDFAADTAIEPFYEDEKYVYSYPCIISNYIVVKYSDGTEETVKEALKNNRIEIGDLDKFDIQYIKQEKFQMYHQTPPDLFVYLDGETKKTQALLGSHSWKITKDGVEEVIMADALHPSQMKYSDNNILELNSEKINIESTGATISSANIYNVDKTENIKKISFDNETIMLGNLEKGEYVLEIVANYSQGNAYYGVKLIVK